MTWSVRIQIAGFVLACLLAAALIGWLIWPSPDQVQPDGPQMQPTEPTRQERQQPIRVAKTPRTTVKALSPEVKTSLNLPAAVSADPDQWLLGTGRVLGARDSFDTAAVYDDDTGETTLYASPAPAPWLAKANETAVALGYVIKPGGPVIRAKVRQDLIRVKDLFGYLEAQADSDGTANLGAFVEWRF